MIYTLTTNPAIDMNINTKTLKPSYVNRTDEVVYTPNGKGINVSFVLRHYGIESKILGFFGGFSGHYIVDEIRKRDYVIEPVWLDAPKLASSLLCAIVLFEFAIVPIPSPLQLYT